MCLCSSFTETYCSVLLQLLAEMVCLGPHGMQAKLHICRVFLLGNPVKFETGERQVPAEPVLVRPPGSEKEKHAFTKRRPLSAHMPKCILGPRSPSACWLQPGAEQEVGVKEEVAQVAFPIACVHQEAVAHQLTPLEEHKHTLTMAVFSEGACTCVAASPCRD